MIYDLKDREEKKACSTHAPGGDPFTPAEGGWATCFFRLDVRNKANLRPECPPFHYSIIPPFQAEADRANRTQLAWLRRAGRGQRDGGRGANAPNKPNFRRTCGRGKWLAGKELWYIAPAIGFGKTKPICPNDPRGARDAGATSRAGAAAYCAKQTQFAAAGRGRPSPRPEALTLPPTGQMCETKPICPATPRGTRPEGRGTKGKCAKRTQFQTMPGGRGLGAIMRNEANSEQVGRGRPTHEETIMQNKAKPGQARVSGGWRWGSSLRKTCETKPICGGVSSVKTGKAVVGASNFTHYTSNSAEGRSCKTKPIARSGAPRRCPPRAGAMDVESAPVCRPHPNPHNATAALALPV
jgi:hypothetical protein